MNKIKINDIVSYRINEKTEIQCRVIAQYEGIFGPVSIVIPTDEDILKNKAIGAMFTLRKSLEEMTTKSGFKGFLDNELLKKSCAIYEKFLTVKDVEYIEDDK